MGGGEIGSVAVKNGIHVILYSTRNVLNQTFVKKLSKAVDGNIPVLLVGILSKLNEENKKTLFDENRNLPVNGIYAIELKRQSETKQDDGFDTLALAISQGVSTDIRFSFVALQKPSSTLSREEANTYVGSALIPAAAAGAIPIDSVSISNLSAVLVKMLANITVTFGLPANVTSLLYILGGFAGIVGAVEINEWLRKLIREIPDIGGNSTAGLLIHVGLSAGLSSVLVCAVGMAYIEVLARLKNDTWSSAELHTEEMQKMLAAIYKDQAIQAEQMRRT